MSVKARRSRSDASVLPSGDSTYTARDIVPNFVSDVKELTSVQFIRIQEAPRPVVEFKIGWTSNSSSAVKAWEKFHSPSSSNEGGPVKCDGDCGKEFDSNDIVQFGCDHNICKKCLAKANGKKNFDGSPGCSLCTVSRVPSRTAISPASTGKKKGRKGNSTRASSRSANSSSSTGKKKDRKVISGPPLSATSPATSSRMKDRKVRLVIISTEQEELVRYKENFDMRERDDLSVVQDRLEVLVKDLKNSMMYLTLSKKFHRRDMMPVMKVTGKLSDYAEPGQTLNVYVLTRGVRIKM